MIPKMQLQILIKIGRINQYHLRHLRFFHHLSVWERS